MIIRKVEEADKEPFAEFIKATWLNPVPFDKNVVAGSLVEDKDNRNYIVLNDSGDVIGGGCWSTVGPTMSWAILKDQSFKLDVYMALIHKCVSDCLAEGFTFGLIPVTQKWLVNLLKLHFPLGVEITETGFQPNSKIATNWQLKIDLAIVVAKLEQMAKGG